MSSLKSSVRQADEEQAELLYKKLVEEIDKKEKKKEIQITENVIYVHQRIYYKLPNKSTCKIFDMMRCNNILIKIVYDDVEKELDYLYEQKKNTRFMNSLRKKLKKHYGDIKNIKLSKSWINYDIRPENLGICDWCGWMCCCFPYFYSCYKIHNKGVRGRITYKFQFDIGDIESNKDSVSSSTLVYSSNSQSDSDYDY